MPDYKQALAAQIAATAEKSAKRLQKEERRRLAREQAAEAQQKQQAQAAMDTNQDAADEFSAGAPSSKPVSLSKTVDQQRQQKADQARSALERAQRRVQEQEAQREAASAAAASEAAASTAAASAASGPALLSDGAAPTAEKVVFTTEMRPGESFRSYQARLVREKAEKMQVEVKGKKMSEKKKRSVLACQWLFTLLSSPLRFSDSRGRLVCV